MDFFLIMGIGTVIAILIVAYLPKPSVSDEEEEDLFEPQPSHETPVWRKDIAETYSLGDSDYMRKLARFQKDPQHWPCPFPPDEPKRAEGD